MSLDARGVLRGSCTACSCPNYNGGRDLMRCACGHPPGKHKVHGSSKGTSTLPQSGFGATTLPSHPRGAAIDDHNYRSQAGVGVSSYSYSSPSPRDHGPSTHYQYHHHLGGHDHYQRVGPKLPQCEAVGCTRPVYCDFNLPEQLRTFKYCSPECRDRELLPRERSKLQIELRELKEALQAAAVASDFVDDKPQFMRQSSHNRSRVGDSGRANPKVSASASSKKSQVTVQVEGDKNKCESFGLLLSKDTHNSDKAQGFIVVGAERDTLAYTMLEMGKLRLFDVVESANDKTATELLVPGKKPQQCFDDHLLGKAHVKIRVNRSISLSPVTNMLKLAQNDTVGFTHVFALKYALSTRRDEKCYGLTLDSIILSNSVAVKGRTEGTPSYNSGILYNDRISMYAIASNDVESSQVVKSLNLLAGDVECDFKKAQDSKKHLILLIQRRRPSSYSII